MSTESTSLWKVYSKTCLYTDVNEVSFFFQIDNENRYENDSVQKIHVQQTMTIYVGRVIVYETNPL